MPSRLRMLYSKEGSAVYISHLDLMRTMQRAFFRAGLKPRYSEGFNPHPVMSAALPLPVGMSSRCELLEFELLEHSPDVLAEELDRALPEGIHVITVYPATRKHKEIKWLLCGGYWEYDGMSAEGLCEIADKVSAFFAAERIDIIKKTKKGESSCDIAPSISRFRAVPAGHGLKIEALISAQEPTLNPDNLTSALKQLKSGLAPEFHSFSRLEVYDSDMRIFR